MMKIFHTGLQRTATVSLTEALFILNIRTKQFPKALYPDIHHPIINQFDAFTDFPIPLLYRELDKAYPGSKFIHTIRDEKAWLKSVEWLFTVGAVKFHLPENLEAQTFHRKFYGIDHFDRDIFLDRFRKYNAEVTAYFAGRPDDFLVLDITAGDGFEKICPFLDLPEPDLPFPNSNQSESLTKVQVRKIRKRTSKLGRRILANLRLRPLIQAVRTIISPLKLTGDPEQLSCRPFFIIFPGRSGSTLLRAILNEHPDIYIPPESNQWGKIVNQFNYQNRFLHWSKQPALVAAAFQELPGFEYWGMALGSFLRDGLKLPPKEQNLARLIDLFYNHYRQANKPTAIRWGDKSINNINFLGEINSLYPTCQFVHIIRDGRDVAASLYHNLITPSLEIAAEWWLEKVQRAQTFGRSIADGRYLEVRYESLVQFPETTVQEVCNFLDLDYQPQMLDYHQNIENLKDASRPLHSQLKEPINPGNIGNWRNLPADQLGWIDEKLEAKLEELGYKVDEE